VICAPGTRKPGAAVLRQPDPSELDAIQSVWEASLSNDDPGSWPRGGWSAAAWATDTRVLALGGQIVGVAAVRAELDAEATIPIRIALAVDARQQSLARILVEGALELAARVPGAARTRLWVPSRADWAVAAAREAGLTSVRIVAHMLLPAETPTPTARRVQGLHIRSIRPGEESAVLEALNRAWTGTWAFVPIPLEMLAHDLEGQREGMLLGFLDHDPHIVGTCHAVYEPNEQNPDGRPRAWISNLTVGPEHRRKGIARAMLLAGITHLRKRGATSITLGVDAGDVAPLRLYQSVGFGVVSSVEAWDKELR
jgi:ribosomal protein S18 acetylase RimI-like enzyme